MAVSAVGTEEKGDACRLYDQGQGILGDPRGSAIGGLNSKGGNRPTRILIQSWIRDHDLVGHIGKP